MVDIFVSLPHICANTTLLPQFPNIQPLLLNTSIEQVCDKVDVEALRRNAMMLLKLLPKDEGKNILVSHFPHRGL